MPDSMKGICRRCERHRTVWAVGVDLQPFADETTGVWLCRQCFEQVAAPILDEQLPPPEQ